MKKFFYIALAALGFAACAEKMDDNAPAHSGEVEESYIAISLMAVDSDTKAEGATYQNGLEAERVVNTAYFFFYQNDEPFPVNVSEGTVNGPGNGVNFLQATLSHSEDNDTPNVSDIEKVVLLLKNYKGDYPNQIIAVLNWTPTAGQSYTLEQLKAATAICSSEGHFVMSNAVYADAANNAVVATPLTLDNIFTTEEDAKAAPVKIHVERIAAKVTVTTTEADARFTLTNKVNIGGVSTAVYAEVLGWELYNDNQKSLLLKDIEPAKWGTDGVGFNWNDRNYFRSYWAKSYSETWGEDNVFTWESGLKTGLASNVAAGTYAEKTYTYCGENTYREAKDRTKVILKAQLQKKKDDNTYEALELARWYGTDYVTEANLKIAVANTLKNSIFYKDPENGNYFGIKPEDIICVVGGTAEAPEGVRASQVYFQLSTASEAKEWYRYDSTNGYVSFGTNDTETKHNTIGANNRLKEVPAAILYKSGQTYYFFDVEHLGSEDSAAGYGIVRNHIYSININSIGGYGSPVYTSTSNIVTPEYPIDPSETESFVAAEVRILSWRLVSQEVNIQPQS